MPTREAPLLVRNYLSLGFNVSLPSRDVLAVTSVYGYAGSHLGGSPIAALGTRVCMGRGEGIAVL